MKISVALCTYNGESYISQQIDSVLNQQGIVPDEIVVCDDKSSDETLKILNNYKILHPNIFKIYSNEINLGSTKNFEKAILLCSGDYIFLSDQDDVWKINKIQQILSVFREHPDAEGVFSNADLIDEVSKPIKNLTIWESVFFFEKELSKPLDFFNIISKNGNMVTGATLCIKSSIKSFIFPFTDDILHDEKIAIQLALRKSLFYATENLISYRLHAKQQIGMKNINKIAKKNRIRRIILELEKPVSFKEYRHHLKKTYLKLNKAKKLQHTTIPKIELEGLILKCKQEFHEINLQMKSKFPLRYYIIQQIDKLLEKRKL
jgi:glycosyltransferase involved in cell wall biosynthesis